MSTERTAVKMDTDKHRNTETQKHRGHFLVLTRNVHVVDEVLVGSVRGLGPVVVGWIATRRHPVPRRVVDSHSAEVHSIPLLIKSLRDLDLTVPAQKGRIWVPGGR